MDIVNISALNIPYYSSSCQHVANTNLQTQNKEEYSIAQIFFRGLKTHRFCDIKTIYFHSKKFFLLKCDEHKRNHPQCCCGSMGLWILTCGSCLTPSLSASPLSPGQDSFISPEVWQLPLGTLMDAELFQVLGRHNCAGRQIVCC